MPIFQYQTIAEPTDVPFDIVFLQTIVTVDQTFVRFFQYPSHASIVIGREAGADESTEWYQQHPIPVLRPPVAWRTNLSIPPERERETDDSHEWYQQHPEPVRRIIDEAFRFNFTITVNAPDENDTSVEWYMQQPIPVLRPVSVVNLFSFGGDILRARRRVVPPPLVEHNPDAAFRTVRHEQYVARIFNSLLLQGEIVQEAGQAAAGKFHLGVQPTNFTDWADDIPPDSLTEALDRIAAALRALGLKP